MGTGLVGAVPPLLVTLGIAATAVTMGVPPASAGTVPAPNARSAGAPALGVPVPAPHASALFRLTDPRLDELSGVGAGIRSPAVLYAQNDGGDGARFFALDMRTGRVRAAYRLPRAVNHDWEDLAVARDSRGVPSVWLADVGDNGLSRSQIEIYRVDEPRVDPRRVDVAAVTGTPQIWRLRYPDGPHDAEALAVSPHGRAYVITKSEAGQSEVFAVPTRPGGGTRTLRRIGRIRLALTGTPGRIPLIGNLTVTGAALSRDGGLLVVRTYTDAYLWRVHDGDVAAALRGRPTRFALPEQRQGEGIGFDGDSLVIDSESVGSTVYRIAIPQLADAHASHPPTPPAPSAPAPSAPAPSAPAPSATAPSVHGSAPTGIGPGVLGTVIGVTAAACAAAVVLTARRRSGRRS